MSLEFVNLEESYPIGQQLKIVAEYKHEAVLPSIGMNLKLEVSGRRGTSVLEEKTVQMTGGSSERISGTIEMPSGGLDAIFTVDPAIGGESSTIKQTIRPATGGEESCEKTDLAAGDWARDKYPNGEPIVKYGNSPREASGTIQKLIRQTRDEYELVVNYDLPIAVGRTNYANPDRRPPERSYEQQVHDWSKGVMKSRVWCNKDNRWYWVTYRAQLNNLSGGIFDLFGGGISKTHIAIAGGTVLGAITLSQVLK